MSFILLHRFSQKKIVSAHFSAALNERKNTIQWLQKAKKKKKKRSAFFQKVKKNKGAIDDRFFFFSPVSITSNARSWTAGGNLRAEGHVLTSPPALPLGFDRHRRTSSQYPLNCMHGALSPTT